VTCLALVSAGPGWFVKIFKRLCNDAVPSLQSSWSRHRVGVSSWHSNSSCWLLMPCALPLPVSEFSVSWHLIFVLLWFYRWEISWFLPGWSIVFHPLLCWSMLSERFWFQKGSGAEYHELFLVCGWPTPPLPIPSLLALGCLFCVSPLFSIGGEVSWPWLRSTKPSTALWCVAKKFSFLCQ